MTLLGVFTSSSISISPSKLTKDNLASSYPNSVVTISQSKPKIRFSIFFGFLVDYSAVDLKSEKSSLGRG